jgi:hypothetical protein
MSSFKTYLAVVEVRVHESRLKELETWQVEPEDFIRTQISEPMKENGLMTKALVVEGFKDAYDDTCRAVLKFEGQAIMAELEEEILTPSMCVGGNCDD